ncbi:MAG TPA: carbon-nitrogen hydrolase family protein [Bryobacteraceae bacterium]|nr:carbon-nitrogen hydrolase family protein [Bryobacteraceae bacterium]
MKSILLALVAVLGAAAAPPETNLVPNAEFRTTAGGKPDGWSTWAPRPALAADADTVEAAGGRALRLRSRGYHTFGKWTARVDKIEPRKTYRFEVLYRPEGIENEQVSVDAILSWCRNAACTEFVQRDYVDRLTPEGEWRRLRREFRAPGESVAVQVELGLRLSEHGAVTWARPSLAEVAADPHRTARIVTTRVTEYPPTLAQSLELIGRLIDRAAAERPDLVLLTETFTDIGSHLSVTESAQPVPGPTTAILSAKARQHHTWVAMSLLERAGEDVFNTAVLIDREGRIAGKYRKVHLPLEEAERGVTPGREYAVFDTDFGKVGMLVCWDHWFTESVRILRLKGAELVLLPVAGDVPLHWDVISRARAIDNGLYIASSIGGGNLPSRIVAPTGEVLAETSEGLAVATVDFDREPRVLWLSVGNADGDPKSLYIKERRPDTYGPLAQPL